MNIREEVEKYNALKKRTEEQADKVKQGFVNLFCDREEIHIGDDHVKNGVKGKITRIEADTGGYIRLFWKKYKKNGELYKDECYLYSTTKYVLF